MNTDIVRVLSDREIFAAEIQAGERVPGEAVIHAAPLINILDYLEYKLGWSDLLEDYLPAERLGLTVNRRGRYPMPAVYRSSRNVPMRFIATDVKLLIPEGSTVSLPQSLPGNRWVLTILSDLNRQFLMLDANLTVNQVIMKKTSAGLKIVTIHRKTTVVGPRRG